MKLKENIRLCLIIGSIFLVLYILFAASPLGQELQLSPEWTIDIKDRQYFLEEGSVAQVQIPFKMGQNMGYFTPEGKISLLETFPFKATISSSYRASYSQNSSVVQFYSLDSATPIGEIHGSGFPFFTENGFFLFGVGGCSLAQYDYSGNKIWNYENYVPIISFSSSPAGVAVGYADGTVLVFSPTGELLQTFEPGGSSFPVILGVDLSDSGQQLACVSGIDRQRFVLAQEKNGLTKVVYHHYLEMDQKEPVLVQFSQDEDYVFYGTSIGIGILDCSSLENRIIKLEGKILSVQEVPNLDLVCVLAKNKDGYSVYFIEGFGNLVGGFHFDAEVSFISVQDDSLYVGKDNTISKMKIMFE